jgi:hypothetical protein
MALFIFLSCHWTNAGVKRLNYKGWPNAIELSNDKVRMVVVPAIGKIMAFSFTDDEKNVIWNNPKTVGMTLAEAGATEPIFGWANFGGERFWVVQQADNAQLRSGKRWPPDETFDGAPWKSRTEKSGALVMTSGLSRECGVRAWRKFELADSLSMVVIRQEISAVDGVRKRPLNLIQNVTVVNKPDVVIAKLAEDTHFRYRPLEKSIYPDGVSRKSFPRKKEDFANVLTVKDGYAFISQPSTGGSGKIYADIRSGWICAIYGNTAFFQLFKFYPDGFYPDGGCSVEVYISSYFELELLSPATVLRGREKISSSIAYAMKTLKAADPLSVEAAKECETYALDFLKKANLR